MRDMVQNNKRQKRLLRHGVAAAACLSITLGTAMALAWLSHAVPPGAPAQAVFDMKFNTSLGLIAGGIGLLCASRGSRRPTLAAACVLSLIGGATVLEYLTGGDFGFDQLVVKDIYYPASAYPGRMAPGSALGFVCVGLQLVLLSRNNGRAAHMTAAELLGFLVLALGAENLIGRLQGIEVAYSWGSHTVMSIQGAAGLVVLGSGLLALAWYQQPASVARVPLWVPGALCLVVLLFDMDTPRGVVAAIGYIPLVFCSLWFNRPQTVFVFAAVATILTVTIFLFLAPNGVEVWMEVLNRALIVGAIWFMAIVLYLRRMSELAFRQSEVRLNAVVDYALDGMISIDARGIVEHFNHACVRIFGYSAAEVVGQNIKMLMPEPYHGEHDGYLSRYHATGEAHIIGTAGREVLARRKDGSIFPMDLSISAYELESGRHYSGTVRDISKRKAIENALRESEQRYELVMRGMSVGLWEWDMAANSLYWSPLFKEMLGLNIEKFVPGYDDFVSRLHPQDRERTVAVLLAHVDKNGPYDVEYRLRRQDGAYIWIHAMGQAAWDDNGKPLRMVGSVDDITIRKDAERKIQEFHDVLELRVAERTAQLRFANKELEEFAYIASHDLKAPLRVIDNASKWLEEDLQEHLTPETRENMNLLRGRVARMEKLLDDLLDYSRIGLTADERYAEIISGDALMENILALYLPPQGFKVIISPSFAHIHVRRMPLQQILMNLIGNAVKHHDKESGCIAVTVEDEDGFHVFSVKDDGPGIPAQFHDQIFKMFQTLRPRDQVEGSGMGLALVRKNITMFGGMLTLDSIEGKGSTFRFTWPKQQQTTRQSA